VGSQECKEGELIKRDIDNKEPLEIRAFVFWGLYPDAAASGMVLIAQGNQIHRR
jgi:hypothetical protein